MILLTLKNALQISVAISSMTLSLSGLSFPIRDPTSNIVSLYIL